MSIRRLPVVVERSSLNRDGSRNTVYPADVRGRFHRARVAAFVFLVAFYAALPWIQIRGRPAVFLDIVQRRFYLFGASFNAQDLWLVFFLLTGAAFTLLFVTALAGRVWCGWACPQTVFLEGVFRPLERWIEGSRERRLRLEASPWTLGRALRRVALHAAYVVAALAIAHVLLSYFVSLPLVWSMVRRDPAAHPEAFAWTLALSAVMYVNFGWFREQFCIGVCPYGRLQSALTDADSLAVGYDVGRGEPRGKVHAEDRGACIDCGRCVVVCPTGIDIRNGLQLDCVACTACIDACDEMMDKISQPRGLIRYDSERGFVGEARRWWRPRIVIYVVLALIGSGVAFTAFREHETLQATLLRLQGAPYSMDASGVRNAFEVHLVNKLSSPISARLIPATTLGVSWTIPLSEVHIDGMESVDAPVFVTASPGSAHGDRHLTLRIVTDDRNGRHTVDLDVPFMAPP